MTSVTKNEFDNFVTAETQRTAEVWDEMRDESHDGPHMFPVMTIMLPSDGAPNVQPFMLDHLQNGFSVNEVLYDTGQRVAEGGYVPIIAVFTYDTGKFIVVLAGSITGERKSFAMKIEGDAISRQAMPVSHSVDPFYGAYFSSKAMRSHG